MNLILKHAPVWLGSVHPPDGRATLVLMGGDGHQVAVPAPLLLAVSPLVRSILRDLLPPPYCPCFLSLPATGEVLEVVRDILTTGKVAGHHVNEVEEVRQVLGILGVEAMIVSYQIESIQVGQVFERDVKEDFSTDGPHNSLVEEKVKMEVIVKVEDRENIVEADEELNKLGQSLKSNICPQTLKLKQTLSQHVKSINGEGEIACNLCSKTFTQKGNLVTHVNSVHEQIKIKCNLCPLAFSDKRNLNQHIKSFHEQIKVECHLCLKKFTQKQGLNRHIKAVHDKIRIQCNLCPQKFVQKYGLKMHIKTVHKQIKIQCSLCLKRFTQKGHLMTHIKAVHEKIKKSTNISDKCKHPN